MTKTQVKVVLGFLLPQPVDRWRGNILNFYLSLPGDHADWTPDPIEADPSKTSRSRKSDDILSTLVNIYGSKELFVNEFRLMLADKLLNNMDFDTDKEIRNLELLKLRFGEASLHNCEIMVIYNFFYFF